MNIQLKRNPEHKGGLGKHQRSFFLRNPDVSIRLVTKRRVMLQSNIEGWRKMKMTHGEVANNYGITREQLSTLRAAYANNDDESFAFVKLSIPK